MLNFFAGAFAVAGLVAAAGPIIIHLLNRRRYRVVHWAAMDFLREALQRNRKVLQLRDLILLLLRVACVLLFGLALARPYFASAGNEAAFHRIWPWVAAVAALGTGIWAVLATRRGTRLATGAACLLTGALAAWGFFGVLRTDAVGLDGLASSRAPVHAVLVLDNSLSMGYESLDGTLLDKAKARAREFVDALPPESRISIIPLCGSSQSYSLDAYRSKDDAREALDRIEVVDRAGKVSEALDLAGRACAQVQDLEAKRIVFLSDQQLSAWTGGELEEAMQRLPELQVAQVSPEAPRNVWVSELSVVDGVADVETPAVFQAVVHNGDQEELRDVQVKLLVGGQPVATQSIDLQPGQEREVEFKHQIDSSIELGRPTFVKAAVQVAVDDVEADRLKTDNRRYLAVPTVAGIPVVFVDQHGEEEDVERGRIGETKPFRRLLAPRGSRSEMDSQLIRVRHRTLDQLDVRTLEDARLVIVAGVERPTDAAVRLLREYVQQGGQLVLAAGADFDPAAWQEAAWLDGQGILPAPLDEQPLGQSLEDVAASGSFDDVQALQLDFASLQHPYFRLPGESEDDLRRLYAVPRFFKAVRVLPVEGALLKELSTQEQGRVGRILSAAMNLKKLETRQAGGQSPADDAQRAEDEAQLRALLPEWLLFGPEDSYERAPLSLTLEELAQRSTETLGSESTELVERTLPKVLATYASGDLPFLVERVIGDGRVLFLSTGVYSSWSTLALEDNYVVMAVFDRIFRQLLGETVPVRNFAAGDRVALPVERDAGVQYTLTLPDRTTETVTPGALRADVYGVTIADTFHGGHYTLAARRLGTDGKPVEGEPAREVSLAVNGPASESDLRTVGPEELEERLGSGANYRWIADGEEITLEGAQIRGRDLWRLLVQLVIVCLLIEMLVLAWPTLGRKTRNPNLEIRNSGS